MQSAEPTAPTNADSQSLAIAGVTEPVILRYFETLNQGNYQATSELFAEDGALQAPFESPIGGRAAIAQYLETEAQGMTALPREGLAEELEDGCVQIQVTGQVRLPLFSVNVRWTFVLSPWKELFLVHIKLLASPQELLKLKR